MTFSVNYTIGARPPAPGEIPSAPDATIYVDFDAGVDGSGTEMSPRNVMPGLSASDTTVPIGTNIICRGTWRVSASNFGQLLRSGTPTKPVVYIGNDPSWGQAILDGSVQLSPAACVNQADAFGNANWASMRRASIVGLGGNNQLDYLHCAYAGSEREPRYFSGYPQLSNDDAFDYTLFAEPASWADVIWKPGQPDPTSLSDFVSGSSRPRILLSAANTAMGLSAGTLEAALDSDCVPILLMRISSNEWYTALAQRCNSDGTVNASGGYLTPILPLTGQAALVTGDANYTEFTDYTYRIFNVPKAMDRAGQYAMNPVAGWLLDWPVSSETLHRATGSSGIRVSKENVWLHGFQICGLSRTLTATMPTGASGSTAVDVASSIDSSTVRVQRCYFPGFGSIGRPAGRPFYDKTGHAARYYNTYERSLNGVALTISDGSGGIVRYCEINNTSGGISVIGDHVRNLTISGNLVSNINDIHGNGLALYANKYGVVVSGNLFKNVDRPIVSEKAAAAYNESLYGTVSTLFDTNFVQASGTGTSAALRCQDDSPAEEGVSLAGNRLDGGATDVPPFSAPPSFSTTLNGPVNGNFGVGAALSVPASTLWDAGSNTNYTRDSAGGLALIAEIDAMTAPPTTYAPDGVGIDAGGWGG